MYNTITSFIDISNSDIIPLSFPFFKDASHFITATLRSRAVVHVRVVTVTGTHSSVTRRPECASTVASTPPGSTAERVESASLATPLRKIVNVSKFYFRICFKFSIDFLHKKFLVLGS